jgi:hypothetical protein
MPAMLRPPCAFGQPEDERKPLLAFFATLRLCVNFKVHAKAQSRKGKDEF